MVTIREIGTCLRLIECDPSTPRFFPPQLEDAVFDLWEVAKHSIFDSWMAETDPVNLQPRVRPLNQRVAEFIRANRPPDDHEGGVNRALDILEAPWPRREEIMLREWFHAEGVDGIEKSRHLVERILASGLEPFAQPNVLPPIELDDIVLICWLGITSNEA